MLDGGADLDPKGYLDAFEKSDVQLICCQAEASSLWLIPHVVQNRFIQSLDWDMGMDITFTWLLTRGRPKGKEVVKYDTDVDHLNLPKQSDVQEVLNGTANSFRINNVYSRYFRVTGSGEVRPLGQEVCLSE